MKKQYQRGQVTCLWAHSWLVGNLQIHRPGGRCQHGGCTMKTLPRVGKRPGVGEPRDPTATECTVGATGSWQQAVCQPGLPLCGGKNCRWPTQESGLQGGRDGRHSGSGRCRVSTRTLAWERDRRTPSFSGRAEEPEAAVSIWIWALGGS